MADKRKRSQNFTSEEKEKLVKLLMDHSNTILNKKTDGCTNEAKLLAWNQLTASFNATGTVHRTKESLQKLWEKMKSESKIDYNTYRRSTFQTGGGPSIVKTDPILEQQKNEDVESIKLMLLKDELETKQKLHQLQLQAAEKDIIIKDLEIEIKKAVLEQVRGGGLALQNC